jgi:hypothetical protein
MARPAIGPAANQIFGGGVGVTWRQCAASNFLPWSKRVFAMVADPKTSSTEPAINEEIPL